MRSRIALLLAALFVALTVPAGPASAAEDPEWIFEGAGWGHGVGMSQYGAYGMALDGADPSEIISHFYSGAQLDQLGNRSLPAWWSDPYPLTVGLLQNVTSFTVQAVNGDLTLCRRATTQSACTPETIPAYAAWTITGDGTTCVIEDATGSEQSGDCSLDITWEQGTYTRAKVGGTEYAHGVLRVRDDGSGEMNVVLDVELEKYLRGIAEMPTTWPAHALEAQAIAARNYAVRRILDTSDSEGTPTRACDCHIYDSTFDQVYAGWSREGVSPNGWVAAVEATTGAVAYHPSTNLVFTAYYSSSSGGATEDNETVWGGAPAAYLRSVNDPWSVSGDVGNPYSQWTVSFTASKLASILGWDQVSAVDLAAGPPGAVVRFSGRNNGEEVETEFQGDDLRTTFDLRSPWVSAVVAPYDFRDVGSSVHREAITFISDLGITKGCNPPENDRFCPDATVTRGQMAAFLGRAVGFGPGEPGRFSDTAGSVFEADIDRLVAAGVTKGCNPPDNDRFCPDGSVTRGQMAAFLVRAFSFEQVGDAEFSDDNGSVFEQDIRRLAEAGVTKGCNPPSNDRFCPDDPITRAEMATFLMRAIQVTSG